MKTFYHRIETGEKLKARRLRSLRISAELMTELVSGPNLSAVAQEGFPPDGKVISCYWDEPRQVVLVVESETFEVVPEGQYPPDMEVRFSSVRPKPESFFASGQQTSRAI